MGPRQAKRSSGRHRTAITKYTDDVFEAAGLTPNDHSSGAPSARQQDVSADSDEEFTLGAEDTRNSVANGEEEGEFEDGMYKVRACL